MKKNKNLIIGGVIALGIILLLRRKKTTTTDDDLRGGAGEDSGLGGGGGGALAQENGGGAIMQTGSPVIVAPSVIGVPTNYNTSLPPDRVNNTLRPLPITRPLFSPKPLFSKPAVSTMPSTSPAPRPATNDVSANISQAVSNATNLRNFSTFNGMADGKVNGLDFGGDLD